MMLFDQLLPNPLFWADPLMRLSFGPCFWAAPVNYRLAQLLLISHCLLTPSSLFYLHVVAWPDSSPLAPAVGCFALTQQPHVRSTGPQHSPYPMWMASRLGTCTSSNLSTWLCCTSKFIWMGCFLSGMWLLLRCSPPWDADKSKKKSHALKLYNTFQREESGHISLVLILSSLSLHNRVRARKFRFLPFSPPPFAPYIKL